MRFYFPTGARPAPIDRNATNKGHTYSTAGVAPHGATTRFSYTTPAGKKFRIETAQATVIRATAAAPVGQYLAVVLCVLVDANQPWFVYAASLDNNVAARSYQNATGPIDLQATEQCITSTSDTSTGGTVNYTVAVKGTEYDA